MWSKLTISHWEWLSNVPVTRWLFFIIQFTDRVRLQVSRSFRDGEFCWPLCTFMIKNFSSSICSSDLTKERNRAFVAGNFVSCHICKNKHIYYGNSLKYIILVQTTKSPRYVLHFLEQGIWAEILHWLMTTMTNTITNVRAKYNTGNRLTIQSKQHCFHHQTSITAHSTTLCVALCWIKSNSCG